MTETIMTLFGPELVKQEKTLKERFDEKWIPEPNSGCWIWEACIVGSKPTIQYGGFHIKNKLQKAHRVSYELYKGKFNKKLHIRHKCDNTYCVNPDHLEPGTHKDNMKDMVQRGRQAKGETNGASKLTEEQVMAIFNDNRTNEKIAKEYGIVASNVSSIKTGYRWGHVTGKKYEKRRLTEEQAKEIYIKAHNGYKVKDLAKEYNIRYNNVDEIKNGRSWSWLTKDIKI